MEWFYFILNASLMPYLCSGYTVKVDRDIDDTKYGWIPCLDTRSSGKHTCTCYDNYNTVMSADYWRYQCMTPFEVGCYFSLLATRQTHLVTVESFTKIIYPPLRNRKLVGIYVWNLVGNTNHGQWYDISEETLNFFTLNTDGSLSVSNLDMRLWQGHVIKVKFNSIKCCLTMKFKGTITYPFVISEFKRGFQKQSTTGKPATEATTTTEPVITTEVSPTTTHQPGLPTSASRTVSTNYTFVTSAGTSKKIGKPKSETKIKTTTSIRITTKTEVKKINTTTTTITTTIETITVTAIERLLTAPTTSPPSPPDTPSLPPTPSPQAPPSTPTLT